MASQLSPIIYNTGLYWPNWYFTQNPFIFGFSHDVSGTTVTTPGMVYHGQSILNNSGSVAYGSDSYGAYLAFFDSGNNQPYTDTSSWQGAGSKAYIWNTCQAYDNNMNPLSMQIGGNGYGGPKGSEYTGSSSSNAVILLDPIHNILVLYRENDADSFAFAQYYQSLRGLNDDQLVGLPCSSNEILANYATFQTEVEIPLKQYLSLLVTPYDDGIKYILVGYNVPGGFYDGGDIISATSRLCRINFEYQKRVDNVYYDRKSSQLLDDQDHSYIKVVSRIDGPTLTAAKAMLANINLASRQGTLGGKFYIDPWLQVSNAADADYRSDVVYFWQNILPNLNMTLYTSPVADPYSDSIIPYVHGDSIVWSAGADQSSLSFFRATNTSRAFFYNVDANGGFTIRNSSDNHWPTLAIQAGYCAVAASMSDPGGKGYLRPEPFVNAILSGSTVAEAFIFASPRFDDSTVLFGDPLMTFRFPTAYLPSNQLTFAAGYDLMAEHVGRAIGYLYGKQLLAQSVSESVANSGDTNTIQTLGAATSGLYSGLTNNWLNDLTILIPELFTLLSPQPTAISQAPTTAFVNSVLATNGLTVSYLLSQAMAQCGLVIDPAYIAVSGSWRQDFPIQIFDDENRKYFYFELDVAADSSFNTILISKDSSLDQSGWFYQKEMNEFEGIPSNGIPSNYAGRLIRYKSNDSERLTRGSVYYVRLRQKDDSGTHAYVTSLMVIHT